MHAGVRSVHAISHMGNVCRARDCVLTRPPSTMDTKRKRNRFCACAAAVVASVVLQRHRRLEHIAIPFIALKLFLFFLLCFETVASLQHCTDFNTTSATPAAQVSGRKCPPSSNNRKRHC